MGSKQSILIAPNLAPRLLRGRAVVIAVIAALMLAGLWAAPAGAQQTTTLPAGKIAGTVYDDANDNGVRDPGEPGLPNVTVEISRELTGPDFTDSVTTDANGEYIFYADKWLLITTAGSTPYVVTPQVPPGKISRPAEAAVQVLNNETTTADFGIGWPVQVYVPGIHSSSVTR